MKYRLAALWLAACAASACAPVAPAAKQAADCPATARDLPTAALYGDWEARFDGLPGVATVHLDKHPDYAGVRGTITRSDGHGGTTVAQLAGDVGDDGALSIDESQDGHRISADWSARMEDGSCGRSFRGTWHDAADDSTHPLVLNRIGHWQ